MTGFELIFDIGVRGEKRRVQVSSILISGSPVAWGCLFLEFRGEEEKEQKAAKKLKFYPTNFQPRLTSPL